MKIINTITLISIVFLTLVQCSTQKVIIPEEHDHSSHSHGAEGKHEHKYMASKTEADTMKVDGFNVLFYSYFKMSDALSVDDKTKAADYAGSMFRAINNISFIDFSKNEKKVWQAREILIKESVINISNSADDLAKQRSYISQLSLNLMELMKTTKMKKPVYLLHCNSTENRKAGNWLSLENNIDRNPYQNNTPEPCGYLIETIE